MGMGERSWKDVAENYADGYQRNFTASTADNIIGIDTSGPIVVYSVTLSFSQSNASGDFALVDGSATGDSGDTRKFRFVVASAATTDRDGQGVHAAFPRGIAFDTGVIVSATTVTGAVSITYKQRYA